MNRLSSSASTVSSIDDYVDSSTMWRSSIGIAFLEQANGIVDSFLVEIDVAKIALLCHFALDLLCYKEGAFHST